MRLCCLGVVWHVICRSDGEEGRRSRMRGVLEGVGSGVVGSTENSVGRREDDGDRGRFGMARAG